MKVHARDFDWLLFGLVMLIALIGLSEIHVATEGTRFAGVYVKQVYFLIAAVIAMVLFSQIDYKLVLESSPWLYGGSVLALAGLLAVGRAIVHSRRWIPIGGAHFQVSEFVKLVIIVVVARYFSETRLSPGWKDVVRVGALVGVPMLLVLFEPDLGTALTFVPIAGMGLLLGGLEWRRFGILALAAVLIMPVAWHVLRPYQKARLSSFVAPEADPLGSGYQSVQSKIAIGAGGLWGEGTAHGSQTQGAFLPVPYADFIFAAFAEEHGFIGALLVLALYLLVLMRLIHNAQLAPDRGAGLVVMGVVAVLAFHLLVNVGMVVGLMPVTGIPLPLMSSGGSSLLFTFAALGMVMNIRMARFVN